MKIKELSQKNIQEILEVERLSFREELRAGEEVYLSRFKNKHTVLGCFIDKKLIGLQCFSYKYILDENMINFFDTWEVFYDFKSEASSNSAIVYNLCVIPSYRGGSIARRLLMESISMMKSKKIQHFLGISRVPSFNGVNNCYEKIKNRVEVRNEIMKCINNKYFPRTEILLLDPLLHWYKIVLKCKFIAIKTNYATEDNASGGVRVLVYKDLNKEH